MSPFVLSPLPRLRSSPFLPAYALVLVPFHLPWHLRPNCLVAYDATPLATSAGTSDHKRLSQRESGCASESVFRKRQGYR